MRDRHARISREPASGSEGEIGGHPGYQKHTFVTSFPALPLSTYGL